MNTTRTKLIIILFTLYDITFSYYIFNTNITNNIINTNNTNTTNTTNTSEYIFNNDDIANLIIVTICFIFILGFIISGIYEININK